VARSPPLRTSPSLRRPRLVSQVPGSRERFTVLTRYDVATGRLLATKLAWERPLEGVASLEDVFRPIGEHACPPALPAW
jgi:hypothetical protein